MKSVELHPEADSEMRAAARWYQSCQPGLGTSFLREVGKTGKRIAGYPDAWPIVAGSVRRCLLEQFPFGLLYRIEGNRIHVLAVMHLSREPGYWKQRLRY